VAKVQAEHAFVAIHQTDGIEARHCQNGFQRAHFTGDAGG
jgi:hypothetical protein